MEEELSNTPEPTTPSYEEETAAAGGEELPPAPEDIELPTEAPPGAPMI